MSFHPERYIDILWPVLREPRRLTDNPPLRVSTGQSESGSLIYVLHDTSTIITIWNTATMHSWEIEYVGNADDLLYEHVASFPADEDKYARYTSIVQSSGMGKSRTVDELSKTHLVVPLNLREESKGDI